MTTQSSTHVIHNLSAPVKSDDHNDSPRAASIWQMLFAQCLFERVQGSEFSSLSGQLWSEHKLNGSALVDALFCCQRPQITGVDPLIVVYLERLLQSRQSTLADCLEALLRHSSRRQHKPVEDPPNTPELECAVILFAARQVLTNNNTIAMQQIRNLLQVLLEWLRAVTKSTQVLIDAHGMQLCDAIGVLAVSVLENPEVAKVTTSLQRTMLLKYLSTTLPQFIALWSQGGTQTAAENAARLIMITKTQPGLEDKRTVADDEATATAQANLQVEGIPDIVVIPTRPAMLVFLQALIFARPVSDDMSVLNYLQSRYKMNHQLDIEVLATDLIVGGFDVLASVVLRKEDEQTLVASKSFLINKVPILLTNLSASMFSSDRLEYCVGQALTRVDNVVFPPPSLGLMSDNGMQDVRQDFLYACAIHSIIRTANVETILAEQPNFTTPPDPAARLLAQSLFEQVSTDSDKLMTVVNELTKMDGNGGARANVVAQVIRNLCLAKDTMALKPVCTFLAGRSQCLDIMTQFMAPVVLVQPLCELLDDWRYEDDQGEYQPIYEEFAAAFLLAFAIISRYDLSTHHLGVNQQSFMVRYLKSSSDLCAPDDLSEDDKKCFTTWTKGLHNPDSITDEVLSCCRPQDFYLMTPTIFGYLLFAIVNKVIPLDAVKTPLEYLCEPFLVPSLIGVLNWLIRLSWKSKNIHQNRPSGEQLIAFQLLMKICKPIEANDSHRSVVTIMAANCLRSVRRLARQYNMNQPPVEQFLAFLQSFGTFKRTLLEPALDLEPSIRSFGSLQLALRSKIQNLTSWAGLAMVNPVQQPPNYDPRLLYQTQRTIGAKAMITLMLDEIRKQSSSNINATPIAIDVVSSLICMPTPDSQSGQTDWLHLGSPQSDGRMSLREALRLEFEQAPRTVRQDAQHTEIVVRLYRRVEAQLAFSSAAVAGAGVDGPVGDLNAQAMLSDLGTLAANEAAAVAAAVNAAAAASVDVGADPMDFTDAAAAAGMGGGATDLDLGIGMDLDPSADLGLLGATGSEDDIFAGLMGDNDMFEFNDL